MRDAVTNEIAKAVKLMTFGYYLWFTLYVALGLVSVLLPGLAAMNMFDQTTNRILAGCGALVAAAVQFLKPHEYATAYDAGLQLAWKTRVAFSAEELDEKQASKEIKKAIDLTTFKYGGRLPAHT